MPGVDTQHTVVITPFLDHQCRQSQQPDLPPVFLKVLSPEAPRPRRVFLCRIQSKTNDQELALEFGQPFYDSHKDPSILATLKAFGKRNIYVVTCTCSLPPLISEAAKIRKGKTRMPMDR